MEDKLPDEQKNKDLLFAEAMKKICKKVVTLFRTYLLRVVV
jgi:hypothetical protein